MVGLSVTVEGLATLQEKMRQFPDLQAKHMQATMDDFGLAMTSNWKMQLRGPRGPRRLGVRSGNLMASITPYRVPGNTAAVEVGTALPYAAIHEYGFSGTVTVRAHTRQGYTDRRGRVIPTHGVRAHQRNMQMPERPHMRPAIRETLKQAPAIIAKHDEAFGRDLARIQRPDR